MIKSRKRVPYFKNITIFLNRTAIPSFTEEEEELLEKLEGQRKQTHPEWKEYILAGFWDKELEKATERAIYRTNRRETGLFSIYLSSFWTFGRL